VWYFETMAHAQEEFVTTEAQLRELKALGISADRVAALLFRLMARSGSGWPHGETQ
jgi:hypothetical protein